MIKSLVFQVISTVTTDMFHQVFKILGYQVVSCHFGNTEIRAAKPILTQINFNRYCKVDQPQTWSGSIQ